MFLSQYNQLKKIKIDTIIDLKIDQAKKNCLNSGLTEDTIKEINFANSLNEAINRDIDIFIEATGNPIVGTVHADKIIKKKRGDKKIKQEYQKIKKYKKMIKFVYQNSPKGTGDAVLKCER